MLAADPLPEDKSVLAADGHDKGEARAETQHGGA